MIQSNDDTLKTPPDQTRDKGTQKNKENNGNRVRLIIDQEIGTLCITLWEKL